MTSGQSLSAEWFAVSQPEPHVFMIEEPLHRELVKSFLIVGEDRAILIDSGMGVAALRPVVEQLTTRPVLVVTSHAHWDHVGSHHEFASDSDVLVHPLEAEALRAGVAGERLRRWLTPEYLLGPLPQGFDIPSAAIPPTTPTGMLHGGECLELGGRSLTVHHAPGHAPGLLVLVDEANGILFSTDAAYAGDLYAQLPGSNVSAYQRTLETLANMAPSLRSVLAAHGERQIAPAELVAMSKAVTEVINGRRPDKREGGVAAHAFDGFRLLVADDADEKEAP